MKERRVVITGMGMVTPLANNAQETWNRLIRGESGIGKLTRFNPGNYGAGDKFPRIAGEVRGFHLENWDISRWGINKKDIRHMDPVAQYALAAAIEAVFNAGVDFGKEDLYRIGVQIGCGFCGAETWLKQYDVLMKKGVGSVSPLFIPMVLANMVAAQISITFGIKGPSMTISSACASGGHAIGGAYDMIRWGRADIMLSGGTDAVVNSLAFSGFHNMKVLSKRNHQPEKASRPFDIDRDGFVMGEGAGLLVLEDLEHARERGAKIYGEMIGYGATSDAEHITEPSVEGQKECMRSALEQARLPREQVGYISAHATSTLVGDISETEAIKQLFGEHAKYLLINSIKSMLGHPLGAGGAMEAICTILALKNEIIPPTINLDNLDSKCDGLDYIPNEARKVDVRHALSNSFGFGGQNSSLAFAKYVE